MSNYAKFKNKTIKDIIRATSNRKIPLKFDEKRWTISLIQDTDELFISSVKCNSKNKIVGFLRDSEYYDEDVLHFNLETALQLLYFIDNYTAEKYFGETSLNYTADFENSESILYL